MARLPQAADISRSRTPTSTPDIRAPRLDTSAAADGARAVARGLQDAGGALSVYAKAADEVDDFETKKKLVDFNLQTEIALEEKRRTMPAGAANFSGEWQKDYDKRARELFKGIPQTQRDRVDMALVQHGASLTERAYRYELDEKDRHTQEGLADTLDAKLRVIEGNPDRREYELEDTKKLIDLAPLTPDAKFRLHKKFSESADIVSALTKIRNVNTAAGFKTVYDELGITTPGADITSSLTSGKSKGKPAGWAATNATWGMLNPFQKAAAMALLEADRMNPADAKNALGAMINRAAKTGEDLGAHVSQKIYQPTIEPAQEGRLNRVIASPAFRQLTEWAQARATGSEPDPVGGATHFLAHEKTMLALESQDPKKYRSWRGWSGFDPTTGQYTGVLSRDGSHAFVAPEGAYDGAGPGYEGPYKNLSFEQRNALIGELKSQHDKVRRSLIDEIESVEKVAVSGRVTPDIGVLQAKVRDFDDPALAARMTFATTKAVITDEMRRMTPQQAANRVGQMREAVGATATPEQVGLLEHMQKVADSVTAEVNKDPLAWSKEIGAPVEQLAFDRPETLKKRAEVAVGISQRYGKPVRLFTNIERDALAEDFKSGGDRLYNTASVMAKEWGPELTTQAMREVSEKAPEAAVAGYLVANNVNVQAARDITTALKRRQDPNYKPAKLSREKAEPIALDALQDVYRNFPPQQRDSILTAADAIYETRIAGKEEDPAVYKAALMEVIGQRKDGAGNVYGGPVSGKQGWFGAYQREKMFLLPPSYRADTWKGVLEAASANDLLRAGMLPPADASGRPISMARVANAKLVQVGPAQYVVSMGDPDSPGKEDWIMTTPMPRRQDLTDAEASLPPTGTPRRPFVLDLNRLEAVMRPKLPGAFWQQ